MMDRYKKFLLTFAYYGVIAALVFVAIRYVLPMLTPFVVGAVIAYFLRFPIRWLHRKAKLPYKAAATLTVLLFFALIGALLSLAGIKAVNWLISTFNLLPTMYTTHALPFFQEVTQNLEQIFHGLDPEVITTLESLGDQLLESASSVISTLSGAAVNVLSGAAISLHTIADGQVEAVEFLVDSATRNCGVPLKQLKLKNNVLIASITHGAKTEIPGGDSTFAEGDTVVVVTSGRGVLQSINDIFA